MHERQAELEVSPPPFLSADSSVLGSEEWEGWMKWDNLGEDISPQNSDLSPPSLQFGDGSTGSQSPPSEFDNNLAIDFSPVYSIADSTKPSAPSNKKRKSSVLGNAATGTRQPRGQKISHNVIEKRYRSNLNDKIAKLRDSVPELRSATPTVKRRKAASQANDEDSESEGLKFNKATVLTKATEYILQLERQNQRLQAELSQIRSRGGSLEKLRNPPAITTGSVASMASSTVPTLLQPVKKAKPSAPNEQPTGMIQVPEELRRFREANATTEHYGASFPSSLPPNETITFPSEPVQGMIPLSDDFKRLREEGSQAHYAPESSYYGSYVSPQDTVFHDVDADETASRWPRSKALSRVLVGSLVGLMFMESFADDESQQDDGSINKRGLFSLPSELKTESRGFRAQIRKRIITFLDSPASGRAATLLLISAIFMAVAFAVFLYLAPKGSKNVREGSVVTTTVATSTEDTKSPTPEKVSNTSLSMLSSDPPPAHLLDSTARVSTLRMLLDQIWSEWLGLDWLKSHHLDEEAFRRGGQPAPGSHKEWPDIKKFVPQFLQGSN